MNLCHEFLHGRLRGDTPLAQSLSLFYVSIDGSADVSIPFGTFGTYQFRGGSREGVEGVATPCFIRTQGRQDSSQARPA